MFLKYIKLTNFKGFDDFYMSFENEDGSPRRMTMLLGENGTGKTNLLKAIALITAGSDADTFLELIGNPGDWVKEGCESCTIEFAYNTKIFFEIRYNHKTKPFIPTEPLILEFHKTDGKSDFLTKNKSYFSTMNFYHYQSEQKYFSAAYGTSRKFNFFNELASFYDKEANITNLGNIFNAKYTLYPLTYWLMNLDYSNDKDIFQFVTQKIDELLRNITFKGIDKAQKQLLFTENGKTLPLTALSEGYQHIMAFMGDMLYKWFSTYNYWRIDKPRYAKLNTVWNESDNFGLILIDEIDLHLHPEWQREFVAFLREKMPPSFQIIMTTHSPIAAQQSENGELFTLKKEDGKINLYPFAGTPYKLLVDELLMSSAFGLKTDESLKVEKWKDEYRMLKANFQRNEAEEKRFSELKIELQMLPEPQGSAYFSEEHYLLLQKIEKELESKKL